MKNKEHYAEEILEMACSCKTFAVEKRTGKIVLCRAVACKECLFKSADYCETAKREWAEAEYKEPLSAKTVNDKFRKFCIGKECEDCEYFNTSLVTDCRIRYVFDNYNVTEKM